MTKLLLMHNPAPNIPLPDPARSRELLLLLGSHHILVYSNCGIA